MLQEYCRRLGIGTSAQEIDDLAAALKALPQQHPLVALLRGRGIRGRGTRWPMPC